MNRNYSYILILLILWYWYNNKKTKKTESVFSDGGSSDGGSGDGGSSGGDGAETIISNFPCQECAEKYNSVEIALDNWINQSKLLMIKSSANDTTFRGLRNEYLLKVHNFINCIKLSGSITPEVLSNANYGSNGFSYTNIVYSNISNSQDPIIRYDPYNVVGRWDVNSPYYQPSSFDMNTINLLKLNANINDAGSGVIFNLLNINWSC